jgi:predicted membrane protein
MDLDVTEMLWNWDTSPAAVDGMRTYRAWSVQVYTSKRVSSTALVVSLVMWHTLAALASTAFGYGFRGKKTPWSLVMIVYIQWLGRGDRCGARGIHIPYWMGSLLELRMEFPTHIW